MKAKYLSLLAVPFLFAACQEEALVNAPTFDKDGQVPVQITLGTPDAMNATRAYTHTDGSEKNLPESSAKGALNNVDWDNYDLRYILEIYDTDKQEDGDNTIQIGDEKLAKERIYLIAPEGGAVSCAPRLTPNRGYQFVVWADIIKESGLSGEVALSREDDATWKAVADNHYNTNGIYDYTEVIADPSEYVGLKNITINDDWTINDETRDAYFVSQYEVVTTATSLNLTLKRPFGKLRVVTTDIEDLKLGTYPQWTKISYNATRPAAFNAFSKEYSEDVVMAATDVFEAGLIYYANESSDANHAYAIDNENKTLFTDYIFGKEGEQTSVQFTLATYEGTNATSRLIHEYAFSTDIPVQRNYLTTLQGNVLTTATDIEIKVDPVFEGNIHFDVEDDGVMMDEEGNYIIVNKNGLLWLAQQVNSTVTRATVSVNDFSGKTVKLACDIDLQGAEWTPIGNGSYPFKGTFDAQKNEEENYTISNFKVTEQEGHAGLFGRVHVGAVKNLNVKDVEIVAHHYAGAIVGQGYVKIENCNVENVDITLTPKWLEDKSTYDWGDKAGAILGQNGEGASFYVKDCSAKNVNINGYRDLGGIIGMANSNNTVSGNSVENITIVQYTAGYTPYDNGKAVNLETLGAVAGRLGANVTYENNDDAIEENKVVIVKTAGEEYPGYYVDANGNYCVTADGGMKEVMHIEGVANVSVILKSDVSVDINAWDGETNKDAFGDENTESYVIDLEGHTLTFNQKNSDWNNIAANNASMTIKNGHITSSGHNDGPWNRHDLNFNCPITLIDITTDKAIALKNNGTLTNVTITDANTSDTYALWIQPKGQTVTLDGCTIDMLACTDGRGIKIDNQYVVGVENGEAKVTLNVSKTTFKTEEKAAILVKTTVGADINLSDVNIAEVAADNMVPVWVDGDAAASFDLVNVTGGYKALEDAGYYVDGEGNYYATTSQGVVSLLAKGVGVINLTDAEFEMPAVVGKTVTFKGTRQATLNANNNVTGNYQQASGSTLTFDGVTVVFGNQIYKGFQHAKEVTYMDCAIKGLQFLYAPAKFENCEFDSNGAEHSVWTYGSNKVDFIGCSFTYGDRAVNCYSESGANHTATVSFNSCEFIKVAGKVTTGAIETNSSSIKSLALNITDCTVNEGDLWWVSEWDSKGGANTIFNGKQVAATSDAINAAISNGASEIMLSAGTYNLPSAISGKTITISGTEETVINTGSGNNTYVGLGGANITFDGVTIKGQTGGQYNGYAHAGTMTYNNCTIEGTITIYSNSTFNECTFNLPKGCYVWTAWGASEVTYDGCTFNTAGKALLVYHESGTSTINVNGCTFNATAGDKAGAIANQNCAAIEIDNSGKGVGKNTACNFTVNTSGNTYSENFSGEWRIKTIDTAGSITVNDTKYTTLALDGKTMTIDADKNVTVQE